MNEYLKKMYFISLTTNNSLRVLQRVSTVFSRNRVNIEQLHVFSSPEENVSHFNIAIYTEERLVKKVMKQLGKIIELHDIFVRAPLDDQL